MKILLLMGVLFLFFGCVTKGDLKDVACEIDYSKVPEIKASVDWSEMPPVDFSELTCEGLQTCIGCAKPAPYSCENNYSNCKYLYECPVCEVCKICNEMLPPTENDKPGKLWLSNQLSQCTEGQCLTYDDWKFSTIHDMKVFKNYLFIAHHDKLERCLLQDNSQLFCQSFQLTHFMHHLEVFANKLWVGTWTGQLHSCDENFNCTKHVFTGGISQMKAFGDNLYIGHRDRYCRLSVCDENANCTDRQLSDQRNCGISSFEVFDNKIWVALGSELRSCNDGDNCFSHGIPVSGVISAMKVFNDKLFIGSSRTSQGGFLDSCDNNMNCELVKRFEQEGVASLEIYDGGLWIGRHNGKYSVLKEELVNYGLTIDKSISTMIVY